MNRIYQGRVSRVQTLRPFGECGCKKRSEHGTKPEHWAELDSDPKCARELGEAALWEHHRLFQDAVNYYIIALAALGVSPDSPLTKLRERLGAVWESFDKRGEQRDGMGESLRRAWQLERAPSLAEAVARFQKALQDDGVPLTTAEKAAEFLLFKLGGETSIKNNGPVFFPMFCDAESRPTYRLSAGRRGRADDETRLRAELHRELSNEEIVALSRSITLGSVVNLQPGTLPDTGEAAIARIKEAGRTFAPELSEEELASCLARLPGTFALPKNRGGAINTRRLHACVLFLAFPNETTKRLFQSTFPAPKAARPVIDDQDSTTDYSRTDADFLVDGQDPIETSRGTRGWVFRAFTALPLWADGERALKNKFDIAAFKEALKVYNQFRQNVAKRAQKLDELATKLLVMDGEKALAGYDGDTDLDRDLRARLARLWSDCGGKPKPPKTESGESVSLARFTGDPRIERLRRIVNADLAEAYRLTDGRTTPYGLRRRTMKGWTDVKREWGKLVRAGEAFSEMKREKLQAKLDALRNGEKREQIGSHKLFEALLADEAAWAVWREPDEVFAETIAKNEWATDPLEAFREYCETREALEEVSRRPLNFTPADARLSRRLFIFTDCCSFGKDGGEYRHDPGALAVTVPVACQDAAGRYLPQPRRLLYAAPRLLRDGIRAEGGGYAQDWTQPMMRALFGEQSAAANPQELKEAAVQLMPDFDGEGRRRILLNFPLDLSPQRAWEKTYELRGQKALFAVRFSRKDKKQKTPLNGGLWESNLQTFWEGDAPKRREYLYWDTDVRPTQPWSKGNWWENVSGFRVLAADLGTRHAASVALVEASRQQHGTSRLIGETGGQRWFARYHSGAILRLPGEDVRVLRPRSRLDESDDEGPFREELHGARGRKASEDESRATFTIMGELQQVELLDGIESWTELRERLSFPEQNDKLLVALRRAQNWIADCVSWHWKLTQPDSDDQRRAALAELQEQKRVPEWQTLAAESAGGLERLRDLLRDYIVQQRVLVQCNLLTVTQRVLPLRAEKKRGDPPRVQTWEWVSHPEKADCHLLQRTAIAGQPKKVLLGGQRGLSMARIEQLSELRRRWQSLNQALRRELGQKPLTASEMRNDPIPDPCPDILRKLENIREQRVNQIAHLILAQALGLKLRPPTVSSEKRRALDLHGEYVVARPPVDLIVLEDLARYLSDQGRAKSENSRLMKWCHRAVMLKVKMLAAPFGIPVLETPAAYSSRFCSLTGAAGFRAVELGWADRHAFPWRTLLKEFEDDRAVGREPSVAARRTAELFGHLQAISGSSTPRRTLLAPQAGGPMFVTAVAAAHPAPHAKRKRAGGEVLPIQADLNAAANLAFRAIAHPDCAAIHHRVRTLRKPGTKTKAESFQTREPRRFGKDGVGISLRPGDSLSKERNSNLFLDVCGVAQFGRARLDSDAEDGFPYASYAALFAKRANDREFQWARCAAINETRIRQRRDSYSTPEDDLKMD